MSLLEEQPVLLLFVVVGLGTLIGRVRIRGFALGPAAVLFVGLAASAVDHDLVLSQDLQTFGLVLFTYVVGLACGPAFTSSLHGRGLRSVAAVTVMLSASMAVIVALGRLLGIGGPGTAGLFAGALTNTPALGAVVSSAPAGASSAAVGYSLAYPLGVVGALVAAHLALRRAGTLEDTAAASDRGVDRRGATVRTAPPRRPRRGRREPDPTVAQRRGAAGTGRAPFRSKGTW